jgi:hypothetical protein
MERSEWIEAVALMRLNWPHSRIDDAVIAKWFSDLEHLPGEQVKVAIEALYSDGREFPPNGAQILAKIIELGREDMSAGEAWRLAHKAALKADPDHAEAWLKEQNAAAAEAVRQISGPYLSYMKADEPIVRAQFRDIYNNIIRAQKRDDAYAGLPSAGLRSLERKPHRIGEALKRALPMSESSEEAA